jgi:hypothetical protein
MTGLDLGVELRVGRYWWANNCPSRLESRLEFPTGGRGDSVGSSDLNCWSAVSGLLTASRGSVLMP